MKTARIVNPKALGDVLRSARLRSGLTQRDLAEELGVTQRYILEIERGKPTKALDRLFNYMQETGVSLYADVLDE